jgi:hypothetical protein
VASLFMRFVHNPNLGVIFKQEEMEEMKALEDEQDEVILSKEESMEEEEE